MRVRLIKKKVIGFYFILIINLLIIGALGELERGNLNNGLNAEQKSIPIPTSNSFLNGASFRYPIVVTQENSIIHSVESTLEVQDDLTVFIHDVVIVGNESGNIIDFSFGLQISSFSISGNLSLNAQVIQGASNSTLRVTILEDSWSHAELIIELLIQKFVIDLGSSYLFLYSVPYKAGTIEFLDLALPNQAVVKEQIIGGKSTPSISPQPSSNYSDGNRLHLRWEPANILLDQPIIVEFSILASPENTYSLTMVLLTFFLGLFLGGLLTELTRFLTRRLKYRKLAKEPKEKQEEKVHELKESEIQSIPSIPETALSEEKSETKIINLTNQERKIIYALLDLNGRASQEQLRKALGWGKSKLSTYIKRLESKELVTQIEVGRKKIVKLISKDIDF